MEEGFGVHHFLTWCAVENLLQIVVVVIQLEFAGVSIEGSRTVLSATFDKMMIASTVDLLAPININPNIMRLIVHGKTLIHLHPNIQSIISLQLDIHLCNLTSITPVCVMELGMELDET
jgi:hypothetical protein